MNPTLQGYAAAILEAAGSGERAGIAGDLEAIEQLVLGNPSLRAALTDTTVRGPDRRAVMLDLLDGKVSEPARRLAAFACFTVSAPDVPAALGWVATRARHLAEGQAHTEGPLSLTQSRQRVGGFATAIHEDSANEQLESVEDDLFRFARIVASTPALRSALVDRDLDVEARQGLVSQLLEGKVQAATVALVRYVVAGGRARDIVGTLDWLVEQTAKARGWRIARVRSAAPIEGQQQTTLSDSLAALAGAPVELQVVLDETLVSGAVIQIGDLQVDATARGRIDALREHLTPGGWEDSGFGAGLARAAHTTTQTEGAG
ncbi:MAG TPA: F0F1 ATP synthase subunit delta [Acidimicrobiales bacterium]|nr:F0F1 ATP synthase subunit delta [Acidimicrobiales bacterium]